MIITVFKTTFEKARPKKVTDRCYRNFDKRKFGDELSLELPYAENYNQYDEIFLKILNRNAPTKQRLVRANEVPYMTKTLRKAISNRSRLENRYYKDKSSESLRVFKRQKNYCSKLYKKERKRYYLSLDVKNLTDNQKFWRNIKPFLTEKGTKKGEIT